jgi:hypothetical protein
LAPGDRIEQVVTRGDVTVGGKDLVDAFVHPTNVPPCRMPCRPITGRVDEH